MIEYLSKEKIGKSMKMLNPAEIYTQKKTKALLSFFIVFTTIPSFAQHPRITQLIAEKQAKMEKLEKCQGTTKSLKIAGISTLGITAVGVGANIAEAVVLNKTKDEVKKATEARDEQKKIKEAREAEEKKRQEEERQRLEEERKQQECQSKHKKYVNGACGECEEGYISKDGNCVEKPKPDESKKQDDGDKQEDKKPDDQNNKKSVGNENTKPGTPDSDKPSTPVEQVNAFSKACTAAGYKPDVQKSAGTVTEYSCFAYVNETATQDIANKKFKAIKESCDNANIKADSDYFVANCGADANGIPNRFYVKQRGGTANNALKQFEKACTDAGFHPTQETTNSGKDYIACIIGGSDNIDAKPADMEEALKAAAAMEQFKNEGCTGSIKKELTFLRIDCDHKNDIRYVYKNLIYADNEKEEFYKRFEKACIESGFRYNNLRCYTGDKNRDAKPADMENALKVAGTNDQFKATGCNVNTIHHMSYGYVIHCDLSSAIEYKYRNLICADNEKEEDEACIKIK